MSDLIDKQQTIDAVAEALRGLPVVCTDIAKETIEQLPPASSSEIPNSSDTISRAKAIDGKICIRRSNGVEIYDDYVVPVEYLEQLPPAQHEIIRCKDCKHWIPYDWMFSEVWQSKNMADYSEDEIGCNLCDVAMKANDFCSRGERRTE